MVLSFIYISIPIYLAESFPSRLETPSGLRGRVVERPSLPLLQFLAVFAFCTGQSLSLSHPLLKDDARISQPSSRCEKIPNPALSSRSSLSSSPRAKPPLPLFCPFSLLTLTAQNNPSYPSHPTMSTAPSDLKEGDDVSSVPLSYTLLSRPSLLELSPPDLPFPLLPLLCRRWKWGASHPSGKVDAVVEGDASITTKNGNSVNRHGGELKDGRVG